MTDTRDSAAPDPAPDPGGLDTRAFDAQTRSGVRTAGEPATGIVWLVGAGPGDPGLMTVRGLECIRAADAIVFDALVNPRLLDHAAPRCELIPAGKRAGRHSMPQDEINQVLAALAGQGRRVCRLKGGDPFLFGRGGEEAQYLFDRRIPFEVVSGVTSAVAVPASAGIPVTHRGLASEVHVVTAHEGAGGTGAGVDWETLARAPGTIVCLMGHGRLAAIADKLIAAGRRPETPAAAIANGTLPSQRTVTGTLAGIAAAAEAAALPAPAILVAGDVVRQRDALRWFERRPLFGRRVVVTRPRAQSAELVDGLNALGAEIVVAPMIQTRSLALEPAMQEAVSRLADTAWVVFTSVAGVDAFFEALDAGGRDARALGRTRVAAVGSATAARVRRFGIRPDLVPVRYTSDTLLAEFAARGTVEGARMLLPRADIAPRALPDGLRAAGADVVELVAYQTVSETGFPDGLVDRIEAGQIDLVVFTSASTVHAFVAALPSDRRARCQAGFVAASIGPETSKTLREAAITIAVEATESTAAGLIQAVRGWAGEPAGTHAAPRSPREE